MSFSMAMMEVYSCRARRRQARDLPGLAPVHDDDGMLVLARQRGGDFEGAVDFSPGAAEAVPTRKD